MKLRAPMRGVSNADRLIAFSEDDECGCRIWTGAINSRGYGHMKVDGRTQPAHRVAYETFVGPIPEGLTIDHLCRVRACINPAHLEAVTLVENVRRGGNAVKTHCVNGHELNEQNTRIRTNGNRDCRVCNTERHRNAYAQQDAA